MTRTKQINPSTFKPQQSLQTTKDSNGTLWVETRPGNWESHLIWEERMGQMRENLEKSFGTMKRKELQSLAKSRSISADQTTKRLIELLISYNIPSLSE